MKKIIIMIVKFYQFILSPDHSFWAKSLNKAPYCKHFPTCSDYMIQSIENRGVIKGGFDGIKRVLRCNPWNKGGVDLPKKK